MDAAISESCPLRQIGWFRFAAAVAIAGLCELTRAQALGNRQIVSREQFFATPGICMLTPIGLEQLFRAGVTDTYYVQEFRPAAGGLQLARNGRN